jgi:selenocysteine lyase/cysteine desulfurase
VTAASPPAANQPPRPAELAGPAAELGSRALFPDLEARAYLAHAAISPASSRVVAAVRACVDDLAKKGVLTFPRYEAQRERLRAALAALLGVEPASIALTPGATRAVTDLALALPLHAGDELVTFEGEFPANVTPWQLAAGAAGARLTFLSAPRAGAKDELLSAVEARLRAGARYVAVSAVQFQTGLCMPLGDLAALCRSADAVLLVDAIQAVGAVPLAAGWPGATAVVGGAHKWLLGVEGAGYAYVSPELAARLRPLTAGWLSHEDGEAFLFRGAGFLRYDRPLRPAPRVFEGSTASLLGLVALEAGVELVLELGVERIFAHLQGYHDLVEPSLVALGFRSLRASTASERSGILSFAAPPGVDVPALAAALRARGVVVSTPDGLIRLAPHFANALGEAPLVASAFEEALGVVGRAC